LSSVIDRLRERESHLKSKTDKAKIEAKEALKIGNERDFRLASKRFGLLTGQLTTISGMIELSQSTLDIIRMQSDFKEMIDIGTLVKECHDGLGIDTGQLEKAITNIRVSNDKINQASSLFTSASEVMNPGQGETETQTFLRAELMAEIKTEAPVIEKSKEKTKRKREKVKST
jgi:hypothetical protein